MVQTSPPPTLGLIFPAHAPPETLPTFAMRAERLGFESLWVVEDCFLSGAISMAAVALSETTDLKVGIGLMPAAIRNPALIAMELGTLAKIFPGRLEVALGHGVERWMQQIGARPARRLAALAETVEAVRRLLAGETVTLSGSHVRLDSVALDGAPVKAPTVLVGTTGSGGLRLAARRADGVLLPEGCGPAFVRDAASTMHATTGGGRSRRTVVYSWLSLDDDADAAANSLQPAVQHWLEGGLYPGPYRSAGIEPGDAQRVAENPELLREVAIVGDPRDCAEGVSRLIDAGADTVAVIPQGDHAESQIERLASEVRPLL